MSHFHLGGSALSTVPVEVNLWGVVQVHERGYRAERAEVVSLYHATCFLCEERPGNFISGSGETYYEVLCEVCAQEPRMELATVAAFWGVELRDKVLRRHEKQYKTLEQATTAYTKRMASFLGVSDQMVSRAADRWRAAMKRFVGT